MSQIRLSTKISATNESVSVVTGKVAYSEEDIRNKLLKLDTCIISYADIIYDNEAIKLLMKTKGDIVILNNTNWKN